MVFTFCWTKCRHGAWRRVWAGAACAVLPMLGQAQMLNYGEAISDYKDAQKGDIELHDKVSAKVSAKTRAAKAIRQSTVLNARDLTQPDGTIALPRNRQNLVIRTNYNDVQSGGNGDVRIASPQIDGNVNGTVILYVEGEGPETVNVINK